MAIIPIFANDAARFVENYGRLAFIPRLV